MVTAQSMSMGGWFFTAFAALLLIFGIATSGIRSGPLSTAGSWAILLFFALGGSLCLWQGGSHLWALHSTPTARVEVVSCKPGKNISCTGVWRAAGGAEEMVQFPNGEGLHVGDAVDAHVWGHQAFVSSLPNSVFSVVIPLVIGVGCLGLVFYLILRPNGIRGQPSTD